MQNIPSLHKDPGQAEWPTKNLKIYQNSLQKRQGYILDRDLGTGVDVQAIILFQLSSGTRNTIYLTATDACKRESSGTWSYLTRSYTTGTVTAIDDSGSKVDVEVQGSSTLWDTSSNVAVGDYYVTTTDLTAASEPDVSWREIESITNDTEVILINTYAETESGNYIIRNQYDVPTGEKWNHAIVHDNLYFCNGNDHVQVWDGSASYASNLDSTNATRARYCLEYADRLVLADMYIGGNRKPFTVKWSKNGDPSDWTHNTAGSTDLEESEDYITGLGKVGPSMVVYKRDSLVIANRVNNQKAPIAFGIQRMGIGCLAPYSIVNVLGTNAFLWRDDFYVIDGGFAKAVGEGIRHKFFDLIEPTEAEKTWGYVNATQNEVRWFATGSDNTQYCFVWNYKTNQWYYFDYHHTLSSGGRGEA